MTNTKKEIYKVLKPHTQNMTDKEINYAIDKLIYLFKNKKKTWHSGSKHINNKKLIYWEYKNGIWKGTKSLR